MKVTFLFIGITLVLMGVGCAAASPVQDAKKAESQEYISPEQQRMMDAKEKSDQVGGYPEAVPGLE